MSIKLKTSTYVERVSTNNFKIVQKVKVSEVVCEHRGRLLNVSTR
jgi:hypothetical protein